MHCVITDDASTAKTLVNIDINKSEKLHAAKSVDIGPVVGLSLAIGLIMSGVIVVVVVVYVRRKKGDTKQAAGNSEVQIELPEATAMRHTGDHDAVMVDNSQQR